MRPIHALSFLLVVTSAVQAQYTVLSTNTPDGVAKNNMMLTCLNNQVIQAHSAWTANIATLTTPSAIATYQAKQQGIINDSLGNYAGFPNPANLDLHPQITGSVSFSGYRVDKVLFQSQPGVYATGNLYVPTASQYAGANPAVVMTLGYFPGSKGYTDMTKMCSLLATNGMVAFAIDPIDAGERFQFLPAQNDNGGLAHDTSFVSNALVGRSLATWETWDNQRALDYLQGRTDIVNPNKLGITGSSAGGCQASYVMAIDNRVKAAVPNSWLTTWKDVLTSTAPGFNKPMGAQDPEQNFYGSFAKGLEQADLVIARAPSPVMISANNNDFFYYGGSSPLSGTVETFTYAKQLYTAIGSTYANSVQLATDMNNEGHGYHKTLREQAAAFFALNLRSETKTVSEPTTTNWGNLTAAQSQVTATGNVADLAGFVTSYQLNVDYNKNTLTPARAAFWQNNSLTTSLNQVRGMANIRPASSLPIVTATDYGTITGRTGYHIEKELLKVDNGMYLPALLYVPDLAPTGALLYVNAAGKASEAGIGQRLDTLAKSGQVVLSLDLVGMGETAQTDPQIWPESDTVGIDYQETEAAFMLGKSYVGIRAENIMSSAQWLIGQERNNGITKVDLLSVGAASGVPALHAAALERQLFGTCTFENNLSTWTSLLDKPSYAASQYNLQNQNVVNGALLYYDLPDLLNLVNPAIPGDANRDGKVTFADYICLELNFGNSGSWSQGDFDGNGVVNFKDYVILESNFGKTSVPEPASLSLLSLGLLTMLRRRRAAR